MGSTGFDLLLILHIVCVIVGYGAVAYDSLGAGQARRFAGAEAYAVAQAGYTTSAKAAQRFLYGVPVFGIAAVAASNGRFSFADLWVSLAFAVYVASLGALHGIVLPAQRRVLVLQGELAGRERRSSPTSGPDSESAILAMLERRQALGRTLFHLLTVAALALMVFKPT